jgi:hypothetical protein
MVTTKIIYIIANILAMVIGIIIMKRDFDSDFENEEF